jgi:hypothetical protein
MFYLKTSGSPAADDIRAEYPVVLTKSLLSESDRRRSIGSVTSHCTEMNENCSIPDANLFNSPLPVIFKKAAPHPAVLSAGYLRNRHAK